MKTKFFIIIIVAAVLVVGVFAFIGLQKSDDESKKETNKEEIEWLTYKSEKYRYQIDYPSTWILDDSQEKYPVDVIYSSKEDAMIAISIFQDSRVLEEDGMAMVLKEVEGIFKDNSSYTIETWETSLNGYLATGSYFAEDGEWKFRESGAYMEDGIGVGLRGNIKKDVVTEIGPIINQMFQSFKNIQ